ncbi:hypothetical protein RJ641_026311 [Dillenia turbinata]|uniref:Ataxin-2 C-terminal domain-containing protein n=1 Tax=Dillenia turbinata TaxID=194707 RepID=A0AAN8ZKU0_9MAGN
MALVSGGRSTLNPDAPLYVPAAIRQVEDFSPEWWQLVTSSTWFRDYWLSQHPEEDIFCGTIEDDDNNDDDIVNMLPDIIDLDACEDFLNMEAQMEEFIQSSETREETNPATIAMNGFLKNGLYDLNPNLPPTQGRKEPVA